MKGELYFNYELTDPRNDSELKRGDTIYVGVTNNPLIRFAQHLRDRVSNLEKAAWIKDLREAKLLPAMRIRETWPTGEEALNREKYWISYYHNLGIRVLNERSKPKIVVKPRIVGTCLFESLMLGELSSEEIRALNQLSDEELREQFNADTPDIFMLRWSASDRTYFVGEPD